MNYKLVAAAAVAAALVFLTADTWAKDDKGFLREAIQGNLAEVSMGQLAQKRSRNDNVKAYGQMLVQDHTEANTRADAVARQIGLKPPTRPSITQRLSHGYLSAVRGNAFDRRFIRQMIDDHKKAIQAYKAQSQAAAGPVTDYAKATLPTLEKHLNEAQALQGSATAQRK